MSTNPLSNIYRKKHFYKVTWTRSEKLLSEIPWLKREERNYCMVGYRQPTETEAQKFIGTNMYDQLYDKVVSVQEISKEEALRDFHMEDWRSQKIFSSNEFGLRKISLDEQIKSASSRTLVTTSPNKPLEKEPVSER